MNNFDEIILTKLGKFPIGAWVPYYREQLCPERLAAIRDCGINSVPTYTPDDEELSLAARAGLKCLVSDNRVTYANVENVSKIREWIPAYIHREEVLGMFVWDEPSPLMMRICGAINAEIQRVAPDTFGYINLHPTYSDPELQREGMTYEEYLEHFVSVASPKLLSFDHYPFLEGRITQDDFYNLQAVRDCCNRHGLEFWSFLQTCRFLDNVTPEPGQIAWQAYTNLAYGAKGLLYFTYATVTHDLPPRFGPALVDEAGNPTPRYYAAQKINAHLERIGRELLTLTHRGVKFFGYPEKDTAGEFAGLVSVSGGPALVGCFTGKEGKNYLLPVNLRDDAPSALTLTFEGGRTQSLSLGAGEGELLEV